MNHKYALLLCLPFISLEVFSSCEMFPSTNIWNTNISKAPVHAQSLVWLKSIGNKAKLHPDFGSGTYRGKKIGIPINLVTANTPTYNISFTYKDESDNTKYPIPHNVKIEGGENSQGDRHIIAIDKKNCMLYELFKAKKKDTQWTAGSGAIFNLSSNNLRPDGWTSADAAGLPVYPGLVRFKEVKSGVISHALRFTIPTTNRKFLWPARHFASRHNNPNLPPMGIRLRLKQSVDISNFSTQAKVIATALKKYGMILADNGSALFLSGEPNKNWNNKQLRDLKKLTTDSFEVVDTASFQKTANSAEALNIYQQK